MNHSSGCWLVCSCVEVLLMRQVGMQLMMPGEGKTCLASVCSMMWRSASNSATLHDGVLRRWVITSQVSTQGPWPGRMRMCIRVGRTMIGWGHLFATLNLNQCCCCSVMGGVESLLSEIHGCVINTPQRSAQVWPAATRTHGVVGHHICLTHRRSPVRIWMSPLCGGGAQSAISCPSCAISCED